MWDGSAVFCLSVYLCIWSTLLGSAVLFPSDSDHSVNTICCALSMSSQPHQWPKMTVTENRGFHAIVQIDEMWHLSGFHLPPDEPIGEEEENIVGRKLLFCSGFSVDSRLHTKTHLITKLCS